MAGFSFSLGFLTLHRISTLAAARFFGLRRQGNEIKLRRVRQP
jgi:hypothetical protein